MGATLGPKHWKKVLTIIGLLRDHGMVQPLYLCLDHNSLERLDLHNSGESSPKWGIGAVSILGPAAVSPKVFSETFSHQTL